MQIKFIKDISDFQSMKPEWEKLYKNSDCTVFQSFEFNYFAWKNELSTKKQNQLTIILIIKNNEIKAIFPFYIDKRKFLRFINDIHADFCDCLAIDDFDFLQIIERVKKETHFYSMRFINIQKKSLLLQNLQYKDFNNCIIRPFERFAFLQLEKGCFPENYSGFRSKHRTKFRRVKKKNSIRRHEILTTEKISFPKKEILSLKEKMIYLGIRDRTFLPLSQLKLLENLYNSRILIISTVKSKEKINAFSFILQRSDEYLFWIDMYDDSKMVNIFNYICLMQKLSAEKNIVMNLGRGTYDYKISNFMPGINQLYAIFIFSNKYREFRYFFTKNLISLFKSVYKKIK
jgi:hypothetical protein|tara:strand:- start:484 stop:1518 length:1035 start_codon:yes stop_codon:yes gene_type:complete